MSCLWIVGVLAAMSTLGAIGLCKVQPSGRNVGLIQFDVVSEFNLEWSGPTSIVVFARYWVCEDYYAVSIIWTEPHGGGRAAKSQIVFSDETAFRMNTEFHPRSVPLNAAYPKPAGDRPSFRWAGGLYGADEMRFAEADALARRVYVSNLERAKAAESGANRVVDVTLPASLAGVTRKVARLKVQAGDDRIESMELFDKGQRSLGKMRYEYERGAGPARVSALVAELPVRPEKLANSREMTISNTDGTKRTFTIPDANYVSHKGGRTCSVTYKDVTLGNTVLRLPASVAVRRSDNKQLLRSARLTNFKRADLDKAGVWEAAKAFGALGSEYPVSNRLVNKFLHHEANLGPPTVDPNDLAMLRRLVARYPVWEEPRPPQPPERKLPGRVSPESGMQGSPKARMEELRQARIREQAQREQQIQAWREQVAKMPRPPRKDIDPNDARLMRQLYTFYHDKTFADMSVQVPEDKRELWNLYRELRHIFQYHHYVPLPEDRAPEPNDADLKLICQLKEHHKKLAVEEDHGLGGRLKAVDTLARLDLVARDYDAFKGHAGCYLQMLDDAKLNQMYMVGGYYFIDQLLDVGQYEKADELTRQWADRSAAANDADAIYRCSGSGRGGKANPWAGVQVLDRFLKKPGLSPLEKYEGLALRAIALDKIDKLLADPNADEDGSRTAQAQWIRKSATRAEMSRMVQSAVRQAVSAWEALGPARLSEARPYSTDRMAFREQNSMEAPDATRLQETSALLDQIVRARMGQRGAAPRSAPAVVRVQPRLE